MRINKYKLEEAIPNFEKHVEVSTLQGETHLLPRAH